MYGFPIIGNRSSEAQQTHNYRNNDYSSSNYVSRPIDSNTSIFDLEKSAQKNFSYIDDYGFI